MAVPTPEDAAPGHPERVHAAAPIVGTAGSFAWHVLHERHPALLERIRRARPYPPSQLAALDALRAELDGVILPVPGDDVWNRWCAASIGRPWSDVPFLVAENLFYRKLLHAVDFAGDGPWGRLDPFEPAKSAELVDPTLEADLAALDALPPEQRLPTLLQAAVWGNRADLGFRIGVAATDREPAASAHLVVDDTAALLPVLDDLRGTLAVVADNAGRELLADLVLIDHLLHAGPVGDVVLHLKPAPYFVSDATTADLIACLRRLAATPGTAAAVAERVRRAIADGRLRVRAHWFFCAPFDFHHLPADLEAELGAAQLVLFKGDLNYRRLVGDCAWAPTTPFAQAVPALPTSVVTLRTLKCDVIVGLDRATVDALDDGGTGWRTDGSHAVVQLYHR